MVILSSASRILFGIVLLRWIEQQATTAGEARQEIRMTERFLIFGHRGSPKRFPENTIASFDEALRAGADGFETDLRLLFDRTAVLYHDDELGETAIESLTYTQCAE